MEYTLSELFPELSAKLSPAVYSVSSSDLETNSYFTYLVEMIKNECGMPDPKNKRAQPTVPHPLKDTHQFNDIKALISKILPKAVPVRVPKGTIVYTTGDAPDQGYFLIHGCVSLLSKKNNWERLENYQGHTIFNVEDRVDFLESNYRINRKNFDAVECLFYEDRMTFSYLPFLELYSGEYFGFKELVRGCLRSKMAIALEDSILVKVKKHEFDKYLKQFQQKREHYIISCMFSGVKPEIVEDINSKISVAFNSAQLVRFDRDEVIFRQGGATNGLYFLLQGQVLQSKEVRIEVPKKYLSNQNQKEIIKQMTIKLHKLVKNSFVGELQPVLALKTRQFTCTACLNSTLLLKLDPAVFLKAVSQSALYERQMTISAKHKYSVTLDLFLKQKTEVVKSYLSKFQLFDHKKKQKNIVGLLNNDANFKQNGLYELFKKEGTFYRDTFQRLEGFEQFESKYDPKRSSINRHKIKSSIEQIQLSNLRSIKREPKQQQERTVTEEADLSFEATKKMLMSHGKSSNPFQLLGSDFAQKISPISEHNSRSSLKKKRKTAPKFQDLKKDQTVFKRVLIKNGRYQVPRNTNKSNIMQAIVNHNFDEVVKQCMSRKNVSIRKALIDNKNDLIKDQFRKTVNSFTKQSNSMTRLESRTSFGYTCKGTDEMRKRLQKLKWGRSSGGSPGERAHKDEDPKLQDCIGFNQQPLSRQIKHRSALSTKKSINRSPQKIILLNHMMKPITYTSSQL